MPPIAPIAVRPETSTERPEVAAAASSAASGPSGGTLLPFALQVEHRVVDADGEPDQQDHRRSLEGDRDQMARQRDQAERRQDGGQGEQERDAGGHERAEREHEDEQRDRERERSGLAEVVAVRGLDALLGAGVAELADREARMGRLRCCNRVQDGLDLVDGFVLVALDGEADERGVAVLCDRPRWTSCTAATRETRATTSVTAAVKAGVPAPAERLRIRTLSSAGCLKPSSRIRSMRPDSPGPGALGSTLLTPIAVPRPKATITKASQPKVAVFQCAALQRPSAGCGVGMRTRGMLCLPPWGSA